MFQIKYSLKSEASDRHQIEKPQFFYCLLKPPRLKEISTVHFLVEEETNKHLWKHFLCFIRLSTVR